MSLLYKRSSLKQLVYLTLFIGVLLLFYYMNYAIKKSYKATFRTPVNVHLEMNTNRSEQDRLCSISHQPVADIDTVDVFPQLDFNPSWIVSGNFWDDWFASRLQDLNRNSHKHPLKVILVPHSHNDPGWLETFQYYLQFKSARILDNIVDKLQLNETFKFIWAEVAFLEGWWKNAGLERQTALRRLIRDGQIEIVTGGWVMPDEAITSLYGLIDQYIEGHQWLKRYLDVRPKYGWSIDPFGHSSTVAHLLSLSGINGTVIQRIHYAWKYWFAYQRSGDFYWLPNHLSTDFILTHNQPFHLYDISGSCGPSSDVCSLFNYNSHRQEEIFAEKFVDHLGELIKEYTKTGSLYKHNVILVPIGNDFSYVDPEELTGNYGIYSVVVAEAKRRFHPIEISFGTVKDYFEAILERQRSFPSLKGDFFPYADPFSHQPSYWSGFYTSRPFLKITGRILEAQLRTCEILYAITLNYARYFANLSWDFGKIVDARRILDLFQHHDAITGTSRSFVVKDYIVKLTNSIFELLGVQRNTIKILYGNNNSVHIVGEDNVDVHEDISKKRVYNIYKGLRNHVILFNSLLQPRSEYIKLIVNSLYARIKNEDGSDLPGQISPVWKYNSFGEISMVNDKYELSFIANIPPLTIVVYQLYYKYESVTYATVFSNDFHRESSMEFPVRNITKGNFIKLENSKLTLVFSGENGFLRKIHKKSTKSIFYTIQDYIVYNSSPYRSGPYLFHPEKNVPINEELLKNTDAKIMVIVGSIYSEMILLYGNLLVQKVKILNTDSYLAEAIFIESTVNLEEEYVEDVEVAMKFFTNIDSKNIFYTDANGFQIQKRTSVPKINVQGNYYPITSIIYIEDDKRRLSLLTGHSLGGSSPKPGLLEVMLDRKIVKDDVRGLDEGIMDNRKCSHRFILLAEDLTKQPGDHSPSYLVNHLANSLNYPLNIYVNTKPYTHPLRNKIILVNAPSLCNVHLVNLRTQPDYSMETRPSRNALLILQSQAFNCEIASNFTCSKNSENIKFNYAIVKSFKRTSLTGIEGEESVPKRNINEMFTGINDLRTYNVTFR